MPAVCSASRSAQPAPSSIPRPLASACSSAAPRAAQLEHRAAAPLGQPPHAVGHVRAACVAAGEHRDHALGDEAPEREEQRVERGFVDPLHVVDDEQQRRLRLELAEGLEDAEARLDRERRLVRAVEDVLERAARRAQQLVDDAEPQLLLERLAAEPERGAVPGRGGELTRERGLPHAGGAADERDGGLAVPRTLQLGAQALPLRTTPREQRGGRPVRRGVQGGAGHGVRCAAHYSRAAVVSILSCGRRKSGSIR